jgi:hypothetical protein
MEHGWLGGMDFFLAMSFFLRLGVNLFLEARLRVLSLEGLAGHGVLFVGECLFKGCARRAAGRFGAGTVATFGFW